MGARVSYTLVGLFVILLSIGLTVAGLWFGGGLQDAGKLQHYSVYITESVAGLSPGAPVTYKGVTVGKVVNIAIDRHNPERIHVVLALEPSTPISAATVATLQLRGLTGATLIELSGYDADAPPPPTPPGEPYPVIQSRKSLLTRLNKAISKGVGTLSQLSMRFSAVLSRRNRQALTHILSNLARLSSTLAANSERINRILASLERVAHNTARITAHLPKTLKYLNRSLQGLDRLSRKLAQAAASLTALARSGQTGIKRVLRTTLPQLEALFAEIHQTINHIDRLVLELKRNPAMLLWGPVRRPAGPGEGK